MDLSISGVDQIVAELRNVSERTVNLSPVLEVAADDTKTLIDTSFRELRSPGGRKWRGLHRSTIKKRREKYGHNRTVIITPLNDTGIMKNSVTATFTPSSIKFGTNVPYAAYHQFGTGRMNRPFMPVELSGAQYVLMTGGAAGRHWSDVREMVIEYIRTGRITE
jgi:phage gpG-like protein